MENLSTRRIENFLINVFERSECLPYRKELLSYNRAKTVIKDSNVFSPSEERYAIDALSDVIANRVVNGIKYRIRKD
ncbi:MAG: hypothetical protein Q7S27_02815 [Nanoarchaeota archaeon]|nr:hypothetical protein [Nanoarchaeota archaeon]